MRCERPGSFRARLDNDSLRCNAPIRPYNTFRGFTEFDRKTKFRVYISNFFPVHYFEIALILFKASFIFYHFQYGFLSKELIFFPAKVRTTYFPTFDTCDDIEMLFEKPISQYIPTILYVLISPRTLLNPILNRHILSNYHKT